MGGIKFILWFSLLWLTCCQIDEAKTDTSSEQNEQDSTEHIVQEPAPQLSVTTERSIALIRADSLLHRATDLDLVATANLMEACQLLEEASQIYAEEEAWEAAVSSLLQAISIVSEYDDKVLELVYPLIQLIDEHLPSDHLMRAEAHQSAAEVRSRLYEDSLVVEHLAIAMPIFKQQEAWESLGNCGLLSSYTQVFLNDYPQAYLVIQAQDSLLNSGLIPEGQADSLRMLNIALLGTVHRALGNIDDAIQVTKESLDISLAQEPLDSTSVYTDYQNLGVFYSERGDHRRALDNYEQAKKWMGNSPDPLVLNNIGTAYNRLKEYDKAIAYLESSLAIIGADTAYLEDEMRAYNSLGVAYRGKGAIEQAMEHYQKAISLPGDAPKFIAWGSLGNLYLAEGEAELAMESLKNAAADFAVENAGIESVFFLAHLYRLMGDVHYLNGDFDLALNLYQEALAKNHEKYSADQVDTQPEFEGVYEPIYFLEAMQGKSKALAMLATAENDYAFALESYAHTAQWIDSLQANFGSEATQLDWSGKCKEIFEEAIQLAYQAYQISNNPVYIEQAFTFLEKSKHSILLARLKASAGKSYAGIPDSILQKEKDLVNEIAFYTKEIRDAGIGNKGGSLTNLQLRLATARNELAKFKEQLKEQYPKYANWIADESITTLPQLQAALPDDSTAFMAYFIGELSAFAFAITKEGASMLPLVSPAEIATVATTFRSELTDVETFKSNMRLALTNYEASAYAFYEEVLSAPLKQLPAAISHLIISPDGILYLLPFEASTTAPVSKGALDDFGDLPYLLQDFRLHYAYSAGLLIKNQQRSEELGQNTKCLAMVGSYGVQHSSQALNRSGKANQGTGLLDLAGARAEVEKVATYFETTIGSDSLADEYFFKSEAGTYGILHLAMHGLADLENANLNHLSFSNYESKTDDNLLYHHEIANLDLLAQMVVLSACETGVGKYEDGEGVFSLARSFMYAGVPSIVMSLWQVSDGGTSKLMPLFYEYLKAGYAKDLAMQKAKQQYLADADADRKHPFYWSAFAVLGDAKALNQAPNHYGLFLALGVGLIGLGLGFIYFKRD